MTKHLFVVNLVRTFGSQPGMILSFWFSLQSPVNNGVKSNFSSAFHTTLLNKVLVQKLSLPF